MITLHNTVTRDTAAMSVCLSSRTSSLYLDIDGQQLVREEVGGVSFPPTHVPHGSGHVRVVLKFHYKVEERQQEGQKPKH